MRIWQRKPVHHSLENSQLPKLIQQILESRGVTETNAIDSLFSAKLKDLKNPFSLHDMDKAVARLCEAFEKNEKICVYADFDLDGTSGLALLVRGFEMLGFNNVEGYQPLRLQEGYGVHAHALEKLKEGGVDLVVTVDVGITAFEALERAAEIGLDVIVTDHHQPKEQMPKALAVVNPNKGFCDSGLGYLSGVGVGFYLFLALKMELQKRGLLKGEIDSKELLDCFVIGTLTDMVPLVHENRSLVKHGLKTLEKTKRPALKALLEELNLIGRSLNSQDVAIRFAPKLNALSRLETGLRPIDIFLEKDERRARDLISSVIESNKKRVDLQASAEKIAQEIVEFEGHSRFIWVWSDQFHRGVVGLVATKLSQKYKVPAFVGAVGEDGKIVGSARAPEGVPLNALDLLEGAKDLLCKFGGHKAAAGFEVTVENAPLLKSRFEEVVSGVLETEAVVRFEYDAIGKLEDVNPAFMKWYDSLGPFGAQFEAPVIRLSGLKLKSTRELKGGHLRLTLAQENPRYELESLWFSPPSDHPAIQDLGHHQGEWEILAEPQWNSFNGRTSLQLLLKDLRVASNEIPLL